MNFILDWNNNLAAMFETKLTFECQSFSIVYVGAVDAILPGMYRGLMFSL